MGERLGLCHVSRPQACMLEISKPLGVRRCRDSKQSKQQCKESVVNEWEGNEVPIETHTKMQCLCVPGPPPGG